MTDSQSENFQVIDVHAHLGPWPRFYFPDLSVGRILKVMDIAGIDRMICSHHAFLGAHFDHAIQESLRAFDESKGRVLNYVVYNPNYPEETMRQVEKYMEEGAFVGVKIHPSFHGCYADDDAYHVVWDYADEKKLTILTHSWDKTDENPIQKFSFPNLFDGYVKGHPDVNLILGHAGGRYNGHLAAAQLAAKHSNVYVDLSGDSYSFGLVEWLVDKVGGDRVLFGSDLPWMDPRTHLGRVLGARINDEEKAKILGLNTTHLFRL